jgi:CRP-like cAMP-binding protein
VFAEGQSSYFAYIIKEGEVSIHRNVYNPKQQPQYEHRLLNHNTNTVSRFNQNFGGVQGFKKEKILFLKLLGPGKMIGEFECLNQSHYQTSAVCSSQQATICRIKKEDLLKILKSSEESLRSVKA